MKKLNNKQATLRGFEALGAKETFRSSKYRSFILEHLPQYTWLVGKSGALRRTEGPIAESISVTDGIDHIGLRLVGNIAAKRDAEKQPSLLPIQSRGILKRYYDGVAEKRAAREGSK